MLINKYIQDLKNLPEPRKTFMEIMKVNRSEVHMANLLAYFFRSEENHKLGKIFVEALLMTNSYSLDLNENESKSILFKRKRKLIKDSEGQFVFQDAIEEQILENENEIQEFVKLLTRVYVKTEDPTSTTDKKQKRIDFVLTTNECVICIEFKINHELNNPLETYQKHIVEIEKKFQEEHNLKRDLIFVVLTPFKKPPSISVQRFIDRDDGKANVFSQVILSHFFKNLTNKIPKEYFKENTNNYSSQYLTDLIQTINNREINFKRNEILKSLEIHINNSNLNSVFHSNKGFVEIKTAKCNFKIRFFDNQHFQIERWSADNKRLETYNPIDLSAPNIFELTLKNLNEIESF
ncbi:hypothetical protein ERX46_16735 [Brumimicrobium glaciale]|uniref:PD-(D/E)XK nuclease family protein n=1 Tax=Brumimicrobium glaciale TaxID=200475 RepID=A0A4Q4KF43_9FLAO|nr:PD-(D/E)XK nuclease family protein [Brumimicrobium glaciale]RYM31328.1 hypothetical protein ERX46_16735 [Brumimicrobium glaciale]